MKNLTYDAEYFDAKQTLECGQIFRFKNSGNGYTVYSADKACYIETKDGKTTVTVNDGDEDYFENFFDIKTDYEKIVRTAEASKYGILKKSATVAKGIRILNQNKTETLFSFIVSQNNRIPRIKSIIERLCSALGEEKEFLTDKYRAFPTAEVMATKGKAFYTELGLGYRDEYMLETAKTLAGGFDIERLCDLATPDLKKALLTLKGVGPKVADCVSLFGYHRTDSFPVDTWIEKIYRQDFNGQLKSREKIAESFVCEFKENGGYFQQYMFYYKRSLEGKE